MGLLSVKLRVWTYVLALLFIHCVALDKSLCLSEPPFSHLQHRVTNPHTAESVGFQKPQARCPPGHTGNRSTGPGSGHTLHSSEPRGAGPKG